jgi:hypothetical protein
MKTHNNNSIQIYTSSYSEVYQLIGRNVACFFFEELNNYYLDNTSYCFDDLTSIWNGCDTYDIDEFMAQDIKYYVIRLAGAHIGYALDCQL